MGRAFREVAQDLHRIYLIKIYFVFLKILDYGGLSHKKCKVMTNLS